MFGPVPSRRLGRSLGVNNVPYKHCSFSCVYCQAGRTTRLEVERRRFYPWERVVREAVKAARRARPDHVTFAPDGEPTLDADLGREVRGIREAGVPVAVLTNSSLLWREDVRADLYGCDLVSVKVDAASEEVFRRVNRPHPRLSLGEVLNGLREFSKGFRGRLITETMLVDGVNDFEEEVRRIARFVAELGPDVAYIAVPTRPPAERWVKPPPEEAVVRAYRVFEELMPGRVRLLTGYEGAGFEASSKDPVKGLLSIVAVHPLRLDYALKLLEKRGLEASEALERMVAEGLVRVVEYRGYRFVVRRFRREGYEGCAERRG